MLPRGSEQEKAERNKIVLLGPFGFGNLGDAATQQAIIHHLTRLLGEVTICAVSLNPSDTLTRHGVKTYPLGKKWGGAHRAPTREHLTHRDLPQKVSRIRNCLGHMGKKLYLLSHECVDRFLLVWKEIGHIYGGYRHLRGSSCLILSGGGQLDQFWGGPWEQPYAVFKWTVLARLAGVKVLVLSVGVGDISSPLTRWFFRRALLLAEYRSFRDQGSSKLAEDQIGIRCPSQVMPDLAYSLIFSPQQPKQNQRLTVGIGPMAYCDPREWAWPVKTKLTCDTYARYIGKLSSFVGWLLEQGHRVVFYPGDKHDYPVINDVIHRSLDGIHINPDQIIHEPIENVDALLFALAEIDVAIASRFHGVLLPHLQNKPVLAISYERKVQTLMTDMGQQQYCLDIDTFEVSTLKQKFNQLKKNRDILKAQIGSKVAGFQKDLDEQYRKVLSIIRP